ncbi:MAG: L,D-transpeptidase family protein [Hyphomicrobium sp.]
MRAGLFTCLLLAISIVGARNAQSEGTPPLASWPVVSGASVEAMHVVPENAPGAASVPAVETGSIAPEAAPPPNADIGQAARALIPVPAPAAPPVATLDAAPSPNTDGPAVAPPPAPTPPAPEEADQAALIALYASRQDEPLWVTAAGYTGKALDVIAELKNAGEWGLDPQEFEVPEVAQGAASRDDLAKAEMNLSLAVLKYARHARGGRIPDPANTLSSYLDRRPQLRDRKTLLEDLAKSEKPAEVLLGLHPQQPQFNLLRQAWLESKRAAVAKAIKLEPGPDLKPGDRNPAVAQLRKRLNLGPGKPGDEHLYDEPLFRAVKGFQALKDISPADGIITAATRTAFAKPIVKGNADQLAANMQLWRWMPEELGRFYVNVNVPEYMIHIVKDGADVFTERVTVGLVDKQTPIFSDQMERVTFRSVWRVPDSIKVKEVWPSLLRGGGLMRQHNLRVKRLADPTGPDVDWQRIDWSKADMGEYFLYRPPGGGNQLGLVKFSFPSKHYVFMHDTPEKYMFNWSRRANSHGCMRIRNPLQMAAVVLGEDQGWERAKVDELAKNGPDHNVIELERKIPIHITYFTASVANGGKIQTWPDIYGHEKRITLALANKYDKIAKGHDHLAPLDQRSAPRIATGPKRQPKSSDSSVQSLMSAMFGGF